MHGSRPRGGPSVRVGFHPGRGQPAWLTWDAARVITEILSPGKEARTVRIGNLSDRLVPGTDPGASEAGESSGGPFGADPQAVYERWPEFREWAATARTDDAAP